MIADCASFAGSGFVSPLSESVTTAPVSLESASIATGNRLEKSDWLTGPHHSNFWKKDKKKSKNMYADIYHGREGKAHTSKTVKISPRHFVQISLKNLVCSPS